MAQLVEELRYKPEGRGFDYRWSRWIFIIEITLPAALYPWGDSPNNKNEYQECFLGVRAAGA